MELLANLLRNTKTTKRNAHPVSIPTMAPSVTATNNPEHKQTIPII